MHLSHYFQSKCILQLNFHLTQHPNPCGMPMPLNMTGNVIKKLEWKQELQPIFAKYLIFEN